MKKWIVVCSLLVSFILSAAVAAAAPYQVLLQKSSDLPVTTFNLTFRVGSADDPEGAEGLANLTARMLREGGVKAWKGQPARTRAELEEYLFPYAAGISVSVAKEQVSFTATSSAKDAEIVFNVLAQMVLAPAFDSGEFERIRSEEMDALAKQWPREDQEELGKAALERQMFGKDHPYAHVVEGTVSGVRATKLEHIQKFYSTHFVQKRLSVGVAGVVNGKLEAKVRKTFKQLPAGESSRADIPAAKRPKGLRMLIVKGPFEATGVHLGVPVSFNRGDREFDSMYLASMAFGKHRSFVGRLMKVVREIRGLNYGTYSYVEEFPYGGRRLSEPTQVARQRQAFTLWARPATLENGCFLLRQVHREVQNLATEGLTKEEFKLGQSHLIGNAPLLATGLERRLGYAIDSRFYGIKGDYLSRLQKSAKAASRAKVNKLLSKNIDATDLEIVVVTPDPDRFKEQILGEQCGIKYAEGVQKPKAVLDEDKLISRHSLGLSEANISVINAEELFR